MHDTTSSVETGDGLLLAASSDRAWFSRNPGMVERERRAYDAEIDQYLDQQGDGVERDPEAVYLARVRKGELGGPRRSVEILELVLSGSMVI